MAHTALHFSLGLAIGTIIPAPSVFKQFMRTGRKSGPLRLWLLASYALGTFATVPNILRSLGVPEIVCSGWWMNLFLFHPLIDRLENGGMLIGELILVGCFSFQYLALLLALRSVLRKTS